MTSNERAARSATTDDLGPVLNAVLVELRARMLGTGAPTEADDAWILLLNLVRKAVLQVLLPMRAGSALEPEDIAQQVMTKLQSERALARLVNSGRPAAYLRAMIRHSAIDSIRRIGIRTSSLAELPEPSTWYWYRSETTESGYGEVRSSGGRALESRLKQLIEDLPEADRQLLRKRFWGDETIAQIARDGGLSYSATAVRLFRLIRRLRTQLGDVNP